MSAPKTDKEPTVRNADGVVRFLGRDDILDTDDLVYRVVDVEEWGGAVRIRCLTGEERDLWEGSMFRQVGNRRDFVPKNLRAKLVALSAVDAEGNRLFSDQDAARLGKKSAAALDRVFSACQELSGIGPEEEEKAAEDFGSDPSSNGFTG